MAGRQRPEGYPQLMDYEPTKFMLPTSRYDKEKADRAVKFIEMLPHTKAEWEGKPFWLLPWQERIIRDVFGIVKEDGMRQFRTVYIEIPKKQGKQLSLDTPIPTPTGFTTMGKIQPGDTVFSDTGRVCHVVAKSSIDHSEQAYRITFKDGEVIEAGENHQWAGEYTYGKNRAAVMTTRQLYGLPKDGNSIHFRIPVAGCASYPETELPVEPYLMGYWLGNGNAVKPEITVMTGDIPVVLENIQKYHKVESAWLNTGDSVVFRIPCLKKVLVPSFHDKVIPPAYLYSSKEQRFRLLQGLMDSDGAISDRKGQAVYTSTEKALSESVSELLWSLGIKNAISMAVSTQRADWSRPSRECGRVETGETIYYVKFTAFDDMKVAGLPRKQQRAVPRDPATRSHYRYIDKIEPIENKGMQCIQVDSPSHQYLVGHSYLPTHNSELAAAIALYLLYADNEPAAEVFSAAADRQQASIVFDVARRMVEMTPALKKRSKIMTAGKRVVNYSNSGYYQVVSADVGGKHGYSISGLVFDELHNQPNRKLWDVLTKGSGDARRQALHVAITTAGTDRNSICFELHAKALDLIKGRRADPTFYPVVYSLPDDADWTDEGNWYRVNPSLGYTVPIERMREAFLQAQENPAEENVFRTLRLSQWVGSSVAWIPDHIYDKGSIPIDMKALERRECYAGLDLSSSGDITALVLMFPPRTEAEKYICLPFFWVPEDTIPIRVRRASVPYDNWAAQGFIRATPGNVIDYAYIQNTIEELSLKYHIMEIAFDRWGSNMLVERLTEMGLTVVPFGQGYKDMSAASKEFYEQLMKGNMVHGGNPVMKWMCGNVVVEQDPAGNIKPTKSKSADKIDGVVAAIMALDRCIRHEQQGSVYDERGLLVF